MKLKLFYLLLISLIVFMASCEKTLNTVTDFNVDFKPMMALSLSNQTIDDFMKGTITRTQPITGRDTGQASIPDARVLLYEDGLLKDSMVYFFADDFYLSTSNLWTPGKTYKVTVSAPGLPSVEGSDVMPDKIVPVSFTKTEKARSFLIPEYSNQAVLCDEITLVFDDPAGQENYYQFDFQFKDTSQFGWIMSYNVITLENNIETDYDDDFDPGASGLMKYGPLYLKDNDFDGQRKTLQFYIPHSSNNAGVIEISLTSMSYNYYQYTRSFQRYSNTLGNPFTEPVQVFTNIKDGAGIFALSQKWIDSL
jgi:hypothetical protein